MKDMIKGKIGFKNRGVLYLLEIGFFMALIALYPLSKLHELYTPWVYNDEIGYWGQAAFLAGYDWSGILKHCEYYSYGYGILLMPLFWLFKNPITMYRAAIVLNVALLEISFILAVDVLRLLYPKVNKNIAFFIAFASVFTSGSIFQANTAWAETVLFFMVWVIFDLFVRYVKRGHTRTLLALLLAVIYIYGVHQRTIGIVMVTILFLGIYLLFIKRNSGKRFILVIMIAALGIIVSIILKSILQDILWQSNEITSKINASDGNGYGAQFKKIIHILTDKTIFTLLIKGIASKLFYFGFATYFLSYYVLAGTVNRLVKIIRHSKVMSTIDFLQLFSAFNFLALLLISAIFMVNPSRNDGFIYGRYAEITLGPIILFGLINVWSNKKTIEEHRLKFIYFFLLLCSIQVSMAEYINCYVFREKLSLFYIMSVAVGRWHENGFLAVHLILGDIFLFGVFVCMLFVLRNHRNVLIGLATVFIVMTVWGNTDMAYKEYVLPWQQQKVEVMNGIWELSNYGDVIQTKDIYFLLEDIHNNDGIKNTVQFLLKDKKILCLEKSTYLDLAVLPDGIIILNTRNPFKNELMSVSELIYENDEISIFCVSCQAT